MAYVSFAEFRARSVMSPEEVDQLEVARPGFVDQCAADMSDEVDAYAVKRCKVPFAPVPITVKRWVVKLMTLECYSARGYNPSDDVLVKTVVDEAASVRTRLKELADGDKGLLELLSPTTAETTIDRGGPIGYSECDPYAWTDVQAGGGH